MPIALSDYLAWLRQSTTVPVVSPARDRRPPEAEQASPGETGQGSSPETSDQSVGGRIGLANALSDPTSAANIALTTMATLAGPLGGLIGKAATMAMAAHNNAQLNAIAQNTPVGVRGLNADDNAPTATPPDIPDDTLSVSPDPPDAAPAGDDPADAGGGVSGVFHAGGLVPDRQRRPRREERITAKEGEYVIQRTAVQHYGQTLLDAINRGEAEVKVSQKSLKDKLTRA